MTKLCVPITAATCEGMVKDAKAAIASGADMIELRLDYLDLDQEFPKWFTAIDKFRQLNINDRVILTCRVAEEGGHYRGEELKRAEFLGMLWQALNFKSYIDIELACWSNFPRFSDLKVLSWLNPDNVMVQTIRKLSYLQGASIPEPQDIKHHHPRVILSRHDFQRTPDHLSGMLSEIASQPCDVIKIAAKANSIVDSLRMLDALHEWAGQRPTIALSMGETGILTRVLAKKFGAFLTFASLDAGKESAPGQLTLKDMREIYRWDAIYAQTKVYGVIGCPIAHSMSPHIHNAAFGAVGHDGVYLHLRVEPGYEAFAAFLDACLARPWLDLSGCSVTIPHKENLLRYVREHGGYIEPLAARIGVANTLVIDIPPYQGGTEGGQTKFGSSPGGEQRLAAYNTDYRGALDALCAGLDCKLDELKRYTFAVLGAGGAARAIVAGLRDTDCRVEIYNRTADKAQALAIDFGATAKTWEEREKIATDVIINCTSIGMWPNVKETPLPNLQIAPHITVFDTIANPVETRLLREARERGCRIINGVSMFVNQAAAQFELWTGQSAPKDLMRGIVMARSTK